MKLNFDIFKADHLPALDSIRFFAAMLVIIDHGGIKFHAGDGVTYFFVLSGFLFSWLSEREWQKTNDINFKKFYLRRTFRIMPAFYASIFFTILAKKLLHIPINFPHALSAMTYTANYYNAFNQHPATGFATYWSLSVEEQFYLIWPMTFLFFRKFGQKSLMSFLFGSVIFVLGWRLVAYYLIKMDHAYLYNAFDTRFDSLAIGSLFGILVMNEKFQKFMQKFFSFTLAPLFFVVLIYLVGELHDDFHYTFGFTIQSILMGFFMLSLILMHQNPLWKWPNSKPLIYLGALSYSMYLFHPWGQAIGLKFTQFPLIVSVLIGAGVTILMAWFSYNLIEKPFVRWRKKIETTSPLFRANDD